MALALGSGSLLAEVIHSELPSHESDKGILKIKTANRGDVIVHKTLLIDRDKDGIFNERMEEFYFRDSLVLTISDLTGGRGIECKNLKQGELSLVYGDGWKPKKILIRDSAASEYFLLMEDGFYQAAPDKVKESVVRQLGAINNSGK